MILILTLAVVIGLLVIVGVFIFLKKKSQPLTPESIPPMPTPQEANLHFTPVNAPIAPVKKPSVNKKLLIAIAVVFNVILIGAVIYIGQSITKPKTVAQNKNALPAATPQPVLPTSVPQNSLSNESVTPTCSPEPACVESKQCDIAAPVGGWCPVPSFSPSTASSSATTASGSSQLSLPSPTVTTAPTPTTAIVQITATPTPTTIIVAAISDTPVPTASTGTDVTAPPATLPETGTPISLLALIIPAIFVAIAFVL